MHIIDAQSPARVEFLDRLNDPAARSPASSRSRPRTGRGRCSPLHVAEAMVQRGQRAGRRPGQRPPAGLHDQHGRQRRQHPVQRGALADRRAGRAARRSAPIGEHKWQGVAARTTTTLLLAPGRHADRRPPDPAPLGASRPCPACSTGAASRSARPGCARRGTRPSATTTGWCRAPSRALRRQRIAAARSRPPGCRPASTDRAARSGCSPATSPRSRSAHAGPAKVVTADANRRMLDRARRSSRSTSPPAARRSATATREDNLANGTAYYTFTKGAVHCISLDTVNPNGYADGSLDTAQLAWLEGELQANSSRYLDTERQLGRPAPAPTGSIVIFSHHTVATMTTCSAPTGSRHDGRDLLLRYPNVVAWVNGHTHSQLGDAARARGRPAVGGGFWEVNTASHVDWPQQSRIVELVDNGDGARCRVRHHRRPRRPGASRADPDPPLELAALRASSRSTTRSATPRPRPTTATRRVDRPQRRTAGPKPF